jgi:hypothetical protein
MGTPTQPGRTVCCAQTHAQTYVQPTCTPCIRIHPFVPPLPADALGILARMPVWHAPPEATAAAAAPAAAAARAARPLALAAAAALRGAYAFRDPGLLAQALTHVSVLGAASYQRLEFLGDGARLLGVKWSWGRPRSCRPWSCCVLAFVGWGFWLGAGRVRGPA